MRRRQAAPILTPMAARGGRGARKGTGMGEHDGTTGTSRRALLGGAGAAATGLAAPADAGRKRRRKTPKPLAFAWVRVAAVDFGSAGGFLGAQYDWEAVFVCARFGINDRLPNESTAVGPGEDAREAIAAAARAAVVDRIFRPEVTPERVEVTIL
jgi:hypothetical protein